MKALVSFVFITLLSATGAFAQQAATITDHFFWQVKLQDENSSEVEAFEFFKMV